MSELDFNTFRQRALAAGFDEALERHWPPDAVVATHSHDFDADAVVSAGEMWLSVNGQTRHLLPGDTFTLPRDTPHDERYGPEGATYWVARRKA
ncbi:MAG: AraC family ligand binding domain-containing protein [Rubrivivax sp.]|nr:AraC family ligand binding domain-containing protein [Rubrivivax sp.]